jgi:predicted nucleic acid-binding protein
MMQIDKALSGVSRLFLDTAPVIYAVERNPQFVNVVDPVFDRLDLDITSVISPVTLAECLVGPMRLGLSDLERAYLNLLNREDVIFVGSDRAIAREAARIRCQYHFQLADALQIATALHAGCDALLTNDHQLKQTTELKVLVVKELEA